ncbi:arginine/serine-rich coiled-coil protein 2-like, partial [Mercenaria mercenaria]|uniref:arginine/serine-rich coiled-coil protein 2-like n=1 Tax=Mercenaria mercenaria TaxID=6596 RepID=UPI00234F2407
MEGHHYMDENGYSYGYDPNQMYYVDPNMQQTEYYPQGQQYGGWGWQPQGYASIQQPMYGGFAQQGMNYDYYNQYDNGMVYGQQGFVNYDAQSSYGRQSVSNSRSKHSYSQNRSRNRQRPEAKQNIATNDIENSNNNAYNSNDGLQKETSSGEVIKEIGQKSGVKDNATEESKDSLDLKDQDKFRNRGSRFQGTDSRTRKFDSRQQMLDKQRGYDRSYRPDRGDKNSSAAANGDIDHSVNNKPEVKSENNSSDDKTDLDPGARPKSYRDARNSGYRRDKQFDRDRKSGQEGGRYGTRSHGADKGPIDNKNNDFDSKISKESVKPDRTDAESPVNDVANKSEEN